MGKSGLPISHRPSIQTDPFSLDTVYVVGDVINLTVAYSGGCREHEFELYMSPAAFIESYPVQADVYLRHEADDDMCEARITRDLAFDLRPVAHLYDMTYGVPGPVILNVHHFFVGKPGPQVRVLYDPEGCWDEALSD